MSEGPAKIDYQTLAEIAARVVLAVENGDPAAAAAKIAKAMQAVATELVREGRLAQPASPRAKAATEPTSPDLSPPTSSESSAPERERTRMDADRYKLRDPVRERLRRKAQKAFAGHLRAELHPKMIAASPSPDVTLVLDQDECIRDGHLYCMLDGEIATDMSYHVRAKYGLTWDEYLKLTGLSLHFPRTKFTIRKAQVRMEAETRADAARKQQEERRAAKSLLHSGTSEKAVPPRPQPVKKLAAVRSTLDPSRKPPSPQLTAKPSKDRKKPTIVMRVEDSVTDDLIFCLFDGVGRRMITRHIRQRWGMSWEEYLVYCNLPHDYPRVAKSYSESHSLKMSSVLNEGEVDEKARERRREKALETKKRHVLDTPTRGLVDGARPPSFRPVVKSTPVH